MMLGVMIFALAMLADTEVAAVAPIAVSCEGAYVSTEKESKKVLRRTAPRVYVIDEAKSDILFWNDVMGKAFSLCETYAHACHFDFFPNVIMSKAQSEGGDYLDVIIDRRTGMFTEVGANAFSTFEYTGTCRPTDMPKADLSARKF